MAKRLSHLDTEGRVRMVDVSAKKVTRREAIARGRLFLHADTLALAAAGGTQKKGNVIAAAHLAAVMAAKRTHEWIPLAHPVPLEAIDVAFQMDPSGPAIDVEARVVTRGRTGVEMEALTAVAAACLTLYDMLKAVDRSMVIGEIAVWEKRGGRSGTYVRASAVPGAPRRAVTKKRAPAKKSRRPSSRLGQRPSTSKKSRA
jgi:cyclic pyranopterin phosphate synthase